MKNANLIALAVPVFLAMIAVELWADRARGEDSFELGDSVSNLGCGVLNQLFSVLFAAVFAAAYLALHRLAPLPLRGDSWPAWALAFVGGTGVLLYLAAWLVIPGEEQDESAAVEFLRDHRERPWLLLGVGVLAVVAVLTFSEVDFWSGPGNLWLAATLVGGALLWAYLIDRGERRPAVVAPVAGITNSLEVAVEVRPALFVAVTVNVTSPKRPSAARSTAASASTSTSPIVTDSERMPLSASSAVTPSCSGASATTVPDGRPATTGADSSRPGAPT